MPASAPRHAAAPSLTARLVWPLALGAALLASIATLVLSIAGTREEKRELLGATLRMTDLKGQVLHLDEWLTMSARMMAATGQAQWRERYAEAEPRLDAAIAEVLSLAHPAAAARFAATTESANRRLVEMEAEALAHVAQGRFVAATELLDSEEYASLKALYLAGLDELSATMVEDAERRLAALHTRGKAERAALLVVILAAAALGLRWQLRLRSALRQTERVARADALTGLPNRRALLEALEAPGPVGLLLLDLDGFKAVNDAHGHAGGDRLLAAVAARLLGHVRGHDLVARLGGDEFAIVIRGQPGLPVEAVRETAEAMAGRLTRGLAEPFDLGPEIGPVRIGTSIGIALAPLHAKDASELLHAADLALYRAKDHGRGRAVAFEPGMEEASRARAELQAELRWAVLHDAIEPHYQPVVSFDDGRIVGHELLARWNHPRLGAISPAEFIPLAERLGLIGPLTRSLLRRGCAATVESGSGLRIAVNLSPLLLEDSGWLLGMLREVLAESGLPAGQLELELTENALVGDLEAARRTVAAVRALGVSVALDDFGTGYSGLRLLSRLPVDRLKIDAGFVRRMHEDEASARIVASVIALAQGLRIGVVAEGVEMHGEARTLKALGCEEGQGWLFGRPEPTAAGDMPVARIATAA